ncbi:MAG: TetR/AcrR family transcriptional regulator [Myxococcota bacterium]
MTHHAAPEVRRAQILEAAFSCFAAKGMDTRMDDIVRASGLSKGVLYFHFRSKDEIFLALFESYEALILAEWDAADREAPLVALRTQGATALRRLLETRSLLDLWLEFFRHPEARARRARVYVEARRHLAATLRRGIEDGSIGPCDPEAQATALTALVEGLLLQAFVEPGLDPLPVWTASFEALERGLRP